jgi:hypothetical protein
MRSPDGVRSGWQKIPREEPHTAARKFPTYPEIGCSDSPEILSPADRTYVLFYHSLIRFSPVIARAVGREGTAYRTTRAT